MPDIAQSMTKQEATGLDDGWIDADWTAIGRGDVVAGLEQVEAPHDPPPAGWLMQRLFVYEELLDILLGVVDVAATSDDADSAAKLAELQGRLDEAVDLEDAIFSSQPQPVVEAEAEPIVQSFARVAAATEKFGGALERRTRRYEAAAKRWRSGLDRQAEVQTRELHHGLRRTDGWRSGLDRESPTQEDEYKSEHDEMRGVDDDDGVHDQGDHDSLAEEDGDEMRGVDDNDDPDSQVDTL